MERFGSNLNELRTARFLLETLGAGIDPISEQELPPDHMAQDPESIRAVHLAGRLLYRLEEELWGVPLPAQEMESHPSRKRTRKVRAGAPWSKGEDGQLVEAFTRSLPMHVIAKAHGRTRGAISSRLKRLGLAERGGRRR